MSKQCRAAILLLLDEHHRQDASKITDDTEIEGALGLSLDEVRRQLDILEELQLTKSANTFGGHSAQISPKGMLAAEELREGAEEKRKRYIGFDVGEK